jgi:predicted DNA-binding protein
MAKYKLDKKSTVNARISNGMRLELNEVSKKNNVPVGVVVREAISSYLKR